MYFLPFVASLGLFSATSASPAFHLEDRAAPQKIHLRVQSQQGSQKYDGQFLSYGKHGGNRFVLVPESDPKSADATNFTISKGSLHVQIPPNMVIQGGEYSTGAIAFGDFVFFDKGKGSNDYLIINKTDGRLTFKPTQSGTPGEGDFRLCPLTHGGKFKALSLGDHGTGAGCEEIYVKTSAA